MNYQHLKDYYEGKRVFITGHTGFKGSWLLTWLHLLGAEIKGFALAPENETDLYHTIQGDTLCQSVIGDIRNKAFLEQELVNFEPDFVFHLAAQPLVRLSYELPSETFSINTLGTAYLLDAVKQLKKSCNVILITTDKVYENKEWEYPYRENDRLGGYDPYSASKACAELVINSYRNSFFNIKDYNRHEKAIASARAGNVIGGGDWARDRIIPDIVKCVNENRSVPIRNPRSFRPWQHVLEPIGGYLHLGTRMTENPLEYSSSWNFGPVITECCSVEDLTKEVIKLWGTGEYELCDTADAPYEAKLLKLDINRTRDVLGWVPNISTEMSILLTVEWYKCFYTKTTSMIDFTMSQVSNFARIND